jgi:glycosyltransferase involved in cell wall biosynthesis
LSKIIHKTAIIINKKTAGRGLAKYAITRTGYFMIRAAKKYEADIYIGHNLGALPATVKAAQANQKPCGFDAEDFHRNEVSDNTSANNVRIRTLLEEKYFPTLNYLSASSPLIASAYSSIFPQLNTVVVLNVFPDDHHVSEPKNNSNTPLKLFWFSQTIGHGRGLEEVIKALETFDEGTFELHLLGKVEPSFKINGKASVHFHEPIPSDELIYFASQYDIGLAVEIGVPFNRDICLTNKIFTYIQAGLCVVASNTSAQVQLLSQYPGIGKIYQKSNPQALVDTLSYYQQHRDELFNARSSSFDVAKHKLNWENESKKFLRLVDQTLARG